MLEYYLHVFSIKKYSNFLFSRSLFFRPKVKLILNLSLQTLTHTHSSKNLNDKKYCKITHKYHQKKIILIENYSKQKIKQ